MSAQTVAPSPPDPRRWLAFGILLLAGFMDLLDSTIVFVALPSISADLGASYAAIEWVVTAYILAFALGLITGGRLGDIHGRKRVFLVGVVGFTAASLIAGLAPSTEVLIGARALQGAMAALMVPQILSIAQVVFPPRERFVVFALYGVTLSLAGVIGPLLGGLLTELDIAGLGWRPIFLINLPIGAFALVAGAVLISESRSEHPLKLDLVGAALVTVALLLVMVPLVEGRTLGWPMWTFVSLALSIPAFALFAAWQVRKARTDGSPLTEPSLFGRRTFVAGLGLVTLLMSGIGSFWLVFVLWLQVGLGFSPLTTALAGIGWPLAVVVAGGIGARLAATVGRRLLNIGLGLMAVGVIALIAVVNAAGPSIQPWQLLPVLAVAGAGMGIVMPSLFDFILADVPPRDAGSASGVVNTVMQIGNALGIAVIGVIFFGAVASSAAAAAPASADALRADLVAAGVPPETADAAATEFSTCFVARAAEDDPSVAPAACEGWETTLGTLATESPEALPAVQRATDVGLAATFGGALAATLWFHVGAFTLSALLAFLLPRRTSSHETEGAWAQEATAA
jgi:EmrB/QacA subfamily drug resistance transporter